MHKTEVSLKTYIEISVWFIYDRYIICSKPSITNPVNQSFDSAMNTDYVFLVTAIFNICVWQ